MTIQNNRRDILKGGLAAAGLGILGIPEWVLPALAQGETLVPFTDLPDPLTLVRGPERRIIDIRSTKHYLSQLTTYVPCPVEKLSSDSNALEIEVL